MSRTENNVIRRNPLLYHSFVPESFADIVSGLDAPISNFFKSSSNVLPNCKYDITGNDIQTMVTVDVPGVEACDIDVFVEKSILKVNAVRKVGDKKVEYSGEWTVADNYDTANIASSLKNGVLTIIIPKCVKEQPKKILVKTTT